MIELEDGLFSTLKQSDAFHTSPKVGTKKTQGHFISPCETNHQGTDKQDIRYRYSVNRLDVECVESIALLVHCSTLCFSHVDKDLVRRRFSM